MRFYTNSGSPVRTVFKLGVDPDTGSEELYAIGQENFQEFIQSAADSCDLNNIIARVRNGEAELLNARAGVYADVRNMPQTLQEMLQTRIDAKRMYENLPNETREKMDFDAFMKDAGSVDWLKNLGFKFDEVKEEVKEEVKIDAKS